MNDILSPAAVTFSHLLNYNEKLSLREFGQRIARHSTHDKAQIVANELLGMTGNITRTFTCINVALPLPKEGEWGA